jgi:hypothetical protein
MRILFAIYRMARGNRNGPVSRIMSPVNEGIGFVTRTGTRVLNVVRNIWNSLGNGTRRVFSNATHTLNATGKRLLTGKRGQRGGRRTRKHRTRKHRR